jgi:uncharacterized phage protein (TIGR01671 family)
MKTLKFRLWDESKKEWSTGRDFLISLDGEVLFGEKSKYEYECRDQIVQQYTGLKDKNGKEIYEGDLIINETSDEDWGNPQLVVWSKYEEVGFAVAVSLNKMHSPSYHLHELNHSILGSIFQEQYPLNQTMGRYEVVGNIFENPELLNP